MIDPESKLDDRAVQVAGLSRKTSQPHGKFPGINAAGTKIAPTVKLIDYLQRSAVNVAVVQLYHRAVFQADGAVHSGVTHRR